MSDISIAGYHTIQIAMSTFELARTHKPTVRPVTHSRTNTLEIHRADSEPADADNLPTVHIPAVHHFDSSAHILIMADGGLQNLKAAYPTLPAPSIPPIGSALGRWIARLHTLTRAVPAHENAEARSMYRYAYAHLAGAFEKFGLDGAVARAIDAEFGGKLATDDACVCHGDFWPGNVLVRVRGGEEEAQLSVVDWEITRRGTGATDVAQFAAEAYLLERFYGDKGLLRAFLEAYVGSVQASGQAEKEEFVRRLVVHFGVHVAFWPTWVKWCEEDETKELVMLGREYMLAGREGNWKAVRKGPLEPVLGLLD